MKHIQSNWNGREINIDIEETGQPPESESPLQMIVNVDGTDLFITLEVYEGDGLYVQRRKLAEHAISFGDLMGQKDAAYVRHEFPEPIVCGPRDVLDCQTIWRADGKHETKAKKLGLIAREWYLFRLFLADLISPN